MSSPSVALSWRLRAAPLAPIAVVGKGEVGLALVRHVLAWTDAELAQLRGVAASGVVVLLGKSEALPWVDGVSYLGRDVRAPNLLLPTQREPDLPTDLVERALLRRSVVPPPLAVLAFDNQIVSVSRARTLSRSVSTAWLGGKT